MDAVLKDWFAPRDCRTHRHRALLITVETACRTVEQGPSPDAEWDTTVPARHPHFVEEPPHLVFAAAELIESRAVEPVACLVIGRLEPLPKIEASSPQIGVINSQSKKVVAVSAAGKGNMAK